MSAQVTCACCCGRYLGWRPSNILALTFIAAGGRVQASELSSSHSDYWVIIMPVVLLDSLGGGSKGRQCFFICSRQLVGAMIQLAKDVPSMRANINYHLACGYPSKLGRSVCPSLLVTTTTMAAVAVMLAATRCTAAHRVCHFGKNRQSDRQS